MNEGIINFIAGTTAGVTCTLVEHPFDTVKVLLQADQHRVYEYSSLKCTFSVLRNQGIKGLYAGLTARLCISGFEHAMMFAVYGCTLEILGAEINRPSVKDVLIAGTATGVCSGLCLTPFELLKCRMQVGGDIVSLHGNNPIQTQSSQTMRSVARSIVRNEGWMGLFRGGTATMMREIPGTTAWLGGYECMKNFFHMQNKKVVRNETDTKLELSMWQTIISGGVSGVLFWTVFFPADVVKTRVQVVMKTSLKNTNTTTNERTPSFFLTMRQLYLEGGIRTLYSGWSLTVLRSFPSNAVLFLTYEAVRNSLKFPSSQMQEKSSGAPTTGYKSGRFPVFSTSGSSTASGMMCHH